MFSQQLAKFKNETKIKTYLRARGPPGVSGALRSLRILRIGRIGSDYIQQQNTSIAQTPCTRVDTMADGWQLTQGGCKVRRPCQSTIVGAACAELRHSDRNLRTAWFEKGDFKIGI